MKLGSYQQIRTKKSLIVIINIYIVYILYTFYKGI